MFDHNENRRNIPHDDFFEEQILYDDVPVRRSRLPFDEEETFFEESFPTRQLRLSYRKSSSEGEEDRLLYAELKERKKRDTRRKLLFGGIGVVVTPVAAYELLTHTNNKSVVPNTNITNTNASNKQLQTAFNNGVASGSEEVRKELTDALDDLEGFTLEAAIEAAKLTRVAYDTFVSPLVTLAATVENDFLTVTLNALIAGREWLRKINEDSPTLAALQTVLQSWVDQANQMPKTVQTITETDLDGAQAYLRALQRKIQEEQALLDNNSIPTVTPSITPLPTK